MKKLMGQDLNRGLANYWVLDNENVLSETTGFYNLNEAKQAAKDFGCGLIAYHRTLTLVAHDRSHAGVMEAPEWAELYRLREAVKGPAGFITWQDAATDERVRRIKAEARIAELRANVEALPKIEMLSGHNTVYLHDVLTEIDKMGGGA